MKHTQDIEASPELLREHIHQQRCWICGKNGWKALSIHLVKKHGLPAAQVREMAYMFKKEQLISNELHDQLQIQACSPTGIRQRRLGFAVGEKQPPRRLSVKAKDIARRKIRAIQPLTHTLHEPFKRPHPCPICGVMVPKARPTYCSPECLHTAMAQAASQRMTPQRVEAFRAVKYKPTPEEQSRWSKVWWRQFKALHPEKQRAWLANRCDSRRAKQVPQECEICGDTFYLPSYRAKKERRIKTCRKPSCRTEAKRRNGLGRRHTPEAIRKMSEHATHRHQIEGGRFGR